MFMLSESHPVLSPDEAKKLEETLFAGDETKEWAAMQRAGGAIGRAVLRDGEAIGGIPTDGRLLVLVGKGHNGGDALLAAETILDQRTLATAELICPFGERRLRPLTTRALQALRHRFRDRVTTAADDFPAGVFDVCLDGLFGFQFRPPLESRIQSLLERVNGLPVRLRAAVDLPSGDVFRADFTYATGSVKSTVLASVVAGRIRYLDLGFFVEPVKGPRRILTPELLAPLKLFRPSHSDKRAYGHLFVIGGSTRYPGAVLMSVLAALRSGVGLVTAFVPENLAPAFAARAPEAMWVGCPLAPAGGLALEGLHLVRERMERATAWVIGPGLAREPETLALAAALVKLVPAPILLDADALQPEIVREAKGPIVVTPHAGEFTRLAGDATLEAFAAASGATVVLKGPITRIAAGPRGSIGDVITYHSLWGGPVLSRGGSGDVLAGLIGGQLAQTPSEPLRAAARGVVWHGRAADALARAHGEVAVNVTQLLDFLRPALSEA